MNQLRPIWICLLLSKISWKSHATIAKKLTKIDSVAASNSAISCDSYWAKKNFCYKPSCDFSQDGLSRNKRDLKVAGKHVSPCLWGIQPKSDILTLWYDETTRSSNAQVFANFGPIQFLELLSEKCTFWFSKFMQLSNYEHRTLTSILSESVIVSFLWPCKTRGRAQKLDAFWQKKISCFENFKTSTCGFFDHLMPSWSFT